jgi:hypothetical protein
LHAGAEISVSIVADDAWLNWGSQPVQADLSIKAARCLFENAAILESGAAQIDTLNRGAATAN